MGFFKSDLLYLQSIVWNNTISKTKTFLNRSSMMDFILGHSAGMPCGCVALCFFILRMAIWTSAKSKGSWGYPFYHVVRWLAFPGFAHFYLPPNQDVHYQTLVFSECFELHPIKQCNITQNGTICKEVYDTKTYLDEDHANHTIHFDK